MTIIASVAFLPESGIMRVGSGTPSVAGDSDTAATRPTSRAHFSVYDRQNACTHGWRGCGDVAEGSPRARGTPGSSKVRNSTGSQRQPQGGSRRIDAQRLRWQHMSRSSPAGLRLPGPPGVAIPGVSSFWGPATPCERYAARPAPSDVGSTSAPLASPRCTPLAAAPRSLRSTTSARWRETL